LDQVPFGVKCTITIVQPVYGGNDYLDIILTILVELILQPIGGFICWVVFRKKSLKEYVKDDWEGNLAAFLLTVALVAVVVVLITL